ncbi:MAG: ATP-binding protein [Myxococcales bacterium]|nr:ATP-binding protein [Myxococcales bacterium]
MACPGRTTAPQRPTSTRHGQPSPWRRPPHRRRWSGAYRLRRKKYLNAALLIIDEVGFQPMTRAEAALFFRLVSYRYQRSSTIITTNKSVKDWGDGAMATAILDRLLHRCHVINMETLFK